MVIGRKGTLGTVFLLNGPHWPHDTTLWAKDLRGHPILFTFYFLRGMKLEGFNVGSANPTLNRNHVHPLPVVVPPQAITERFADTLAPLRERSWHNEAEARTLTELRDLLLDKLISGELRVPTATKMVEAVL